MLLRVRRDDSLTGLVALIGFDLDVQLVELFFGQRLRRLHHRSLPSASHRECLYLAQICLAREIHDDALDADGNAAVRRGSVLKRVQHMADALAGAPLPGGPPPLPRLWVSRV